MGRKAMRWVEMGAGGLEGVEGGGLEVVVPAGETGMSNGGERPTAATTRFVVRCLCVWFSARSIRLSVSLCGGCMRIQGYMRGMM